MKTQKKHKALSRGKIIAIGVALLVAAFGITLGVMLALRGNLGYKEALNDANEIMQTKVDVSAFLNGEAKDLKLDDEAAQRMEKFESASGKIAQYMESLSASAALKNQQVSEKYEAAKEAYGKLEEVAKLEKLVAKIMSSEEGLGEDEMAELEKSESEFLQKLTKQLGDYRKAAKEFVEKYGELEDVDEKQLIEDYGNFQITGEELADDYAEVSFKDVFGYDKDEVLSFYEKIEELIAVLNEKV